MKPLKPRHRARLLEQISRDVEAAATLVSAAAAAARHDAGAGREAEALRHLLGVEGEVFDAGRLITLAAYVSRPGSSGAESAD